MLKKKFSKVAVSGSGDSRMTEYGPGNRMWRNADGQLHRIDGAAIERADGAREWWVEDKTLTEAEFNRHPAVLEFRRRKEAEEKAVRMTQEALQREQHQARLARLDGLDGSRRRK